MLVVGEEGVDEWGSGARDVGAIRRIERELVVVRGDEPRRTLVRKTRVKARSVESIPMVENVGTETMYSRS